ncbi:MAG TPA: ParA family protein [Myxococcota bacterium]|nr:ParA family protein [Myxococcota bacterium]
MRMTLSSFNRPTRQQPEKALQRGECQATVIAVAAQKGGVGKTTTTVALAAAWARFHGKKVLVVDLDPQAHVNVALGDMVHLGGGNLSEVLLDGDCTEIAEIATKTSIENLDVTPVDPELIRTEQNLTSKIGKELVLKNALEITRSHYDLILLDCPPNIGSLTVNALVAADHVLIPCNPTALAVSGVSGLFEVIEEVAQQLNPWLGVLGVVLTRVDGRNVRTNTAVMDLLEDSWGEMLLPVRVGTSNSLAEAQLAGRDVHDFAPRSRGATQYQELAKVILDRIV